MSRQDLPIAMPRSYSGVNPDAWPISTLPPDERDLSIQETLSYGMCLLPVNRARARNHHEELPRLIGLTMRVGLERFPLSLCTRREWKQELAASPSSGDYLPSLVAPYGSSASAA